MKRRILCILLACLMVMSMASNTVLATGGTQTTDAVAAGKKQGDANGDGRVLANDAMMVLQYSVKAITADRLDLSVCDMDGNGNILANDAMAILKYSVNPSPEPEPDPEEKTYLPDREENFTFLVNCDQGEAYLRKNLKLTGEKGTVSYTATEEDEGIYRIAPVKPYQQYETYYARLSGELAFVEYDTKVLEFSIIGPDYAEVEFNEDNLIFLKNLELQQYGTSGQYDLQWDEEAQRYYLTLFQLTGIDSSMIGKIIGIGDYTSTDEILEDGSRELCFGKLDKIRRNAEGQLVLELTLPELSDVYDELDIYFTGGTGDVDIEGDPEAAFTEAVVNSEGFAEYLAATHLAAESYAKEHGLVIETLTKSAKDNLKFELTKHQLKVIDGTNACKLELGGKITYKVPLKTKSGQLSGSIEMSCYTDITSEISAGGHFKDKKSTELYLTNTTTTTLGFETKFDLEYSEKSETTYLVHNTTHKIHTETCRIAQKETNSANLQKLTAQELSELYNGDKAAMQHNECKVCKAVTGLDGTAYAYNRNTGVLHCMNCIHVGSIQECNLYTLYPANTFGFDTCENCRPQDRQNKDFDKRMENAIQGSDWGETVKELRETLGDSMGEQKPGPDSDPALSANFNVLGVFNIRLGVEPVVEFDMKASAKFEITAKTVNQYGIRSKVKGFETFHDEKTENPKIDLKFTGEADAKFGIELSAKAYPTGFGEAVYIEIKGEVGLYGHLTGILSVEGELGGDVDAYCAARLEAGIYAKMGGYWKILWFDDNFEILKEQRIPLLKWGYDRMYYAFEEEEIAITVSDPNAHKLLKLSDVMEAKYLDLTDMQYGSDTISLTDSSQARVAVEITNEDGTPCDYVVYSDGSGIIYGKNNAPEEFTAVVTVQVTPRVLIDSVGDFLASGTADVKTPVYGYSMDPLVIKIHVKEKDEPKLLKQVKVYSGDNIKLIYTLHHNQDQQLIGADYKQGNYGDFTDHFTYTYDEDGRLLLADRNGSWIYFDHDEYVYNDAGLLTCYKCYWGTTRIPYYQYDYEYDKQGRLTKETYLLPNDDDTAMEIRSQFAYEYDEQGNKIKTVSMFWDDDIAAMAVDGESYYAYDEHGNVIKADHFSWNDAGTAMETDSVSTWVYIYDDQGHIIEEQWYDSEYPDDIRVSRYLYDVEGRVITEYFAEIPAGQCNPKGNPDWGRYDQTRRYYDYLPIEVTCGPDDGEERVALRIKDSVGETVWYLDLWASNRASLVVDDEGYLVGITGLDYILDASADRCELIYDEEGNSSDQSMSVTQTIVDKYVPFSQSLPQKYTASDGSIANERSCAVVEFEIGKPNLVVRYCNAEAYGNPGEFYEVWIIYGIENGKVVELYRNENYASTRRDMHLAYSTDGGYALREEQTGGYYELIIRYPENVTDTTLFEEYKYIPVQTEDYGVLRFWNSSGDCIDISM